MAGTPPTSEGPSPDVPPGRPDMWPQDVPIADAAPARRRRAKVILVGAALVIAGVVAVVALASSRPTTGSSASPPPSGLIRYSSDSPVFTVDHPAGWEEASFPGTLVVFATSPVDPSDTFAENVNVLQQQVPEGTSLQEYTDLSLQQARGIIENFQVVSSRTTTLGTLPAQELEYTGGLDGRDFRFFATWTISGTSAYVLTYTAEPASYERYRTEAVAIIRSFHLG